MLTINKKINTDANRRLEIIADKRIDLYDINIWGGNLNIVKDSDAVKNMILCWCNTIQGERLFMPEYGNDLINYLKRNVSAFSEEFNFESWLQRLEDDIAVITINVAKSKISYFDNTIAITINYTINGSNIEETLNLSLDDTMRDLYVI